MFIKSSAQLLAIAAALLPVAVADVSVYSPPIRELEAFYRRQFDQKYETMRQSNIVNQQDRRNRNEQPKDMLPCRSSIPMAAPVRTLRGDTVQYLLRFNNPHDGQCEINLWKNNQTMPVQTPVNCGGGFRRETFNVTIPANAPECGPNDGCFLQFYFYSVEPRDYAACTDIVIGGAAPAGLQARQTQLQPAKMFQDGYDHSMVDDDYNQYRGQQQMTQKLADRFELEKCVGSGRIAKELGVIPGELRERKKSLRNEIQTAIKQLEDRVRRELQAGDKALEEQQAALKRQNEQLFQQGQIAVFPINEKAVGAEEYGVYDLNDNNADRQVKNTYLPLDYSGLRSQFQQRMDQLCSDLQAVGAFFPFSDGVNAQQILSREQGDQLKRAQRNGNKVAPPSSTSAAAGANKGVEATATATAAAAADNKGAEATQTTNVVTTTANKVAESTTTAAANKGAESTTTTAANKGAASTTAAASPTATANKGAN